MKLDGESDEACRELGLRRPNERFLTDATELSFPFPSLPFPLGSFLPSLAPFQDAPIVDTEYMEVRTAPVP